MEKLASGLYFPEMFRIRSLGSAALNMCAVAAGRADAYWEFGIHAWDIAAADLIVREAGGVVMSTDGQFELELHSVLCIVPVPFGVYHSHMISH